MKKTLILTTFILGSLIYSDAFAERGRRNQILRPGGAGERNTRVENGRSLEPVVTENARMQEVRPENRMNVITEAPLDAIRPNALERTQEVRTNERRDHDITNRRSTELRERQVAAPLEAVFSEALRAGEVANPGQRANQLATLMSGEASRLTHQEAQSLETFLHALKSSPEYAEMRRAFESLIRENAKIAEVNPAKAIEALRQISEFAKENVDKVAEGEVGLVTKGMEIFAREATSKDANLDGSMQASEAVEVHRSLYARALERFLSLGRSRAEAERSAKATACTLLSPKCNKLLAAGQATWRAFIALLTRRGMQACPQGG